MTVWSEEAKKRNRDRMVPYDIIESVLEQAHEHFPDADQIKPVFWGGTIWFEVWKNGRADLFRFNSVVISKGKKRR